MVPITKLSDACLTYIFKKLPPTDLLNAGLACSHWRTLVPKVVHPIDSLTILVGHGDLPHFISHTDFEWPLKKIMKLTVKENGEPMFADRTPSQWDILKLDWLDENIAELIVATFKNVHEVQCAFRCISPVSYEHLVYLLQHWSRQLTSFRLFDTFARNIPSDIMDHLFKVINSMSALKHLTIYLHSLAFRDLPILSRLEEFGLYLYKPTIQPFFQPLQQYAEGNPALRRVALGNYEMDSQISPLYSLSEQLRSRFTAIQENNYFKHCTGFHIFRLEPISTHFSSLLSLTVNILPNCMSTREVFYQLSKFSHLEHLLLLIDFYSMQMDEQPDEPMSQLSSVKVLELAFYMNSHANLSLLNLHWTVPNVQVINVYIEGKCNDCELHEYSNSHIPAYLMDDYKRCLRQMFGPLKLNCTRLCKIFHNCEGHFGTVEELLADG